MDGGHPELVQKFIKEGKLPNFERMMREGVFKEALEPFPTITPPTGPPLLPAHGRERTISPTFSSPLSLASR